MSRMMVLMMFIVFSLIGVLLYGSSLSPVGLGVNSDAVFSFDWVIAGFAAS